MTTSQTLTVAALTIVLNAAVSSTVKFAPDERTAWKTLGRRVLFGVMLVANSLVLFAFVAEMQSSEPLSRRAVGKMIIEATLLTLTLGLVWMTAVLKLLERMVAVLGGMVQSVKGLVSTQDGLVNTQERHLAITERVSDAIAARGRTVGGDGRSEGTT